MIDPNHIICSNLYYNAIQQSLHLQSTILFE